MISLWQLRPMKSLLGLLPRAVGLQTAEKAPNSSTIFALSAEIASSKVSLGSVSTRWAAPTSALDKCTSEFTCVVAFIFYLPRSRSKSSITFCKYHSSDIPG